MRLPKLVPRAKAIAAACPPCAHPLAGFLVQGPHFAILNQLLEQMLMLLLAPLLSHLQPAIRGPVPPARAFS